MLSVGRQFFQPRRLVLFVFVLAAAMLIYTNAIDEQRTALSDDPVVSGTQRVWNKKYSYTPHHWPFVENDKEELFADAVFAYGERKSIYLFALKETWTPTAFLCLFEGLDGGYLVMDGFLLTAPGVQQKTLKCPVPAALQFEHKKPCIRFSIRSSESDTMIASNLEVCSSDPQMMVRPDPNVVRPPPTQVAVFALVKNSEDFIHEWIVYHLLLGVDHFFLYEHDSTDATNEIVQPWVDSGVVTLVNFDFIVTLPRAPLLGMCINHCLVMHGRKYKWLGHLSTSQFVHLSGQYHTIPQMLNDLADNVVEGLPSGLLLDNVYFGNEFMSQGETSTHNTLIIEKFIWSSPKAYENYINPSMWLLSSKVNLVQSIYEIGWGLKSARVDRTFSRIAFYAPYRSWPVGPNPKIKDMSSGPRTQDTSVAEMGPRVRAAIKSFAMNAETRINPDWTV